MNALPFNKWLCLVTAEIVMRGSGKNSFHSKPAKQWWKCKKMMAIPEESPFLQPYTLMLWILNFWTTVALSRPLRRFARSSYTTDYNHTLRFKCCDDFSKRHCCFIQIVETANTPKKLLSYDCFCCNFPGKTSFVKPPKHQPTIYNKACKSLSEARMSFITRRKT